MSNEYDVQKAHQRPANLVYEELRVKDLEWARELHNDPEVLRMLTDPREVDEEQQRSWFKRLLETSSSSRVVVKDPNKDGAKIGLIRIDSLDHNNKSVCIGLDIHKDFRGKGYAKRIYWDLFALYFKVMGFNRIWLLTAEYNETAIALYTKLGFKVEGRQRQSLFRDGKYHDCICMSILREEYESNPTVHT